MPTADLSWLLYWPDRTTLGNQSLWVPGEVWSQGWNLKALTERHHQEWSLRLNLTQHGKSYQARTPEWLTDWGLFLDSVGGGAWPFLVRGVICLVNSDNERGSTLLTRVLAEVHDLIWAVWVLRCLCCYSRKNSAKLLRGTSRFQLHETEQ